MPKKGMRTIFLNSPSPSRITPSPSPSRITPPPSPLHYSFSDSLMDENIDEAQTLISKWDASDSKSYCSITSLFSADNRIEAKQYLNSVTYLQQAMQYFASQDPMAEKLVQAQNLMAIAMRRLEKEFYRILKSSSDYLDPESVSTRSSRSSVSRSSVSDFENESEDEWRQEDESISRLERVSMAAVADLRAIAGCMISSGYSKECLKIYKIVRKSIIEEALYHLGVEKLTLSQLQKMDWEVVEVKIKNWLNAVKVAVKTLFNGERILCDEVFSAPSMRESCFSEISRDGALLLFGFPENVAKCKTTPEKMFRILDLYEAITDLWPEIQSIFSYNMTSTVRQTAVNSLIKLGEAVRTMLTDFETAIQKETSKIAVPGGGVHPLTRYVMNYITFLTDYTEILSDIIADSPLTVPSPLPVSYFGSPEADKSHSSPVSVRLAWIVLMVLCKLDGKAELYKDVALSYLFLANNLQYVIGKVRSSNLKLLLGDDWIVNHESKVQQYAEKYVRMGWSKMLATLPEDLTAEKPVERVKDHFRKFNSGFEETYKKQSAWTVPDPKLREWIKLSLGKRVVPVYKEFYDIFGGVGLRRQTWNESIVRYTPEDIENYFSDLFTVSGSSGSVSSDSSSRGAQ